MSSRVHLKLSGDLEHLRFVWQAGEAALEAVAFRSDPEMTRYNVLLATQEMVTNVLRHGNGREVTQTMEVEFRVDTQGCTIVLRDQGPPFDPLSYQTGDLDELFDMPDGEGGWGIHIARTIMDEVEYHREGEWNVLTMAKYVRSPVTGGTES